MAKSKSTRFNRKPTPAQVARARRSLAADGALPPEAGDPELRDYLSDILHGVQCAEEVALTVMEALQGMNVGHSADLAGTLRRGCADELTEQIERLENAIKGVCIAGASLMINSNRLAPGGDSQAQEVVHG